jgi:hypothetical protein
MRHVLSGGLVCGILLMGTVAPAQADIIFFFNQPGIVQPSENLLFNDPSLVLTGTTVTGLTNQSMTLMDITGVEPLVADGGQARVSAVDGAFTTLTLSGDDVDTFFDEFEARLTVFKPNGPTPTGEVTVTVTNNFGNQETGQYSVGAGQNYFSLLAVDPQLIRSIQISSTVPLENIEQIRFGGIQEYVGGPSPTVPEPATLTIFGTALLLTGRRLRRTSR